MQIISQLSNNTLKECLNNNSNQDSRFSLISNPEMMLCQSIFPNVIQKHLRWIGQTNKYQDELVFDKIQSARNKKPNKINFISPPTSSLFTKLSIFRGENFNYFTLSKV